MSRRLEVLLHGSTVGELAETAEGGTVFRFVDAYYDATPRPVLGQRFEDDLTRVHRSRERAALPDFFANLIPEGRLRELIEQTSDVEPGDDLALLAYVGRDLPGAVVVRPFAGEDVPSEERAHEPRAAPDEEGEGGLRFSLAGVQLKLSMLREGEKLTMPFRGRAGDWIAKFDSPSFPHLPENEHSMLEWARSSGFDVPECHLHDLDDLDDDDDGFLDVVRQIVAKGTKVLAIRRYDRTKEGAVHQEDFAQAVGLPPAKKYDQIRHEVMAHLVRRFVDEAAVDEYLRRIVLAVATGNGDAHLKNWSLLYPNRVHATLSPVYDQVSTVAWSTPARALALKLAGVKEFGRIDRETVRRFAERAGVAEGRAAAIVDETLERLRDAWRRLGGGLPLVAEHRAALEEHWRRVPLLRGAGALA